MRLDRLQGFKAVMGEDEADLPVANLTAEFLEDESLQIRLVVDH